MSCAGHLLEAQAGGYLKKPQLTDTGHFCTCICFKHGRAHRCWIKNGEGRPENCCQNGLG